MTTGRVTQLGRTASCAGLVLAFATFSTKSEGFRNPPPGAFALGRAGGRVAQVDDASAVYHNAANMTDLKETTASASAMAVYISIKYQSPTGETAKTRDPWKLLPSFFYAVPFAEGKFAAGLAITSPYGLSNEWERSGAFGPGGTLRYLAPYFTELKTINANPAIAYKINEKFQVAAGLDVMWSELTLKQYVPLGGPEGLLRLKGDGFGYGGNAAATWNITEKQRLAVTYRSPIQVDYSGSSDLYLPAGTSSGNVNTAVTYPTIISAGYGIKLTDTIRLETDVEWLQFSNFDTLNANISNVPGVSTPQKWRNTFTAGIAGDWAFHPDWAIRAGYQFYETPVPDYTFSPTIPDGNQQVFTTSLAFHRGHHQLEFAYGGIFYDDRNITQNQNPAFVGKYQMMVHLFALSYNFSF
jgi:long-chain fatty acid transport protein